MHTKPLHVATTTAKVPSPHLTPAQAATLLGLPPGEAGRKRLLRLLLDREKSTGRSILVRRGTARTPRYFITVALLEECCPELFARRVQLTEAMQEEFFRIDRKLGAVVQQNLRLPAEVARLSGRGGTAAARTHAPAQ